MEAIRFLNARFSFDEKNLKLERGNQERGLTYKRYSGKYRTSSMGIGQIQCNLDRQLSL